MKRKSPAKDLTDLFYIDESKLSTTDKDVFRNLREMNFDPADMADPKERARYIKYLEAHKDDEDVGDE